MKSKEQLMEVIAKAKPERYAYLKEFFKCIPEKAVQEIFYAEVRKEERILSAKEPCDSVYIVLEGDVKGVDYYKTGNVYSFLDFSEMFIIGDFELFSSEPVYRNSIYANQDCRLLKIASRHYLNWIQHDENALFLRLKNIVTMLPNERELDREYLRMGCKERVMHYLVHYYEKKGKAYAKDGRVKIRLTQAELSEKVGFNIRSVQRAIASLEAEGLADIESGKMVLSEQQYLKLVNEIR